MWCRAPEQVHWRPAWPPFTLGCCQSPLRGPWCLVFLLWHREVVIPVVTLPPRTSRPWGALGKVLAVRGTPQPKHKKECHSKHRFRIDQITVFHKVALNPRTMDPRNTVPFCIPPKPKGAPMQRPWRAHRGKLERGWSASVRGRFSVYTRQSRKLKQRIPGGDAL